MKLHYAILPAAAAFFAVVAAPSTRADTLAEWVADSYVSGSWLDSASGASLPAVPSGSPAKVAGALNGHAVLRFHGAPDLFTVAAADSPLSGASNFTVAVVFRTSAAGAGAAAQWYNNTGLVDAEQGGVTYDWGLVLNGAGQVGAGLGGAPPGDRTLYSPAGLTNGSAHVAVYTRTGDTLALNVDGASYSTLAGASTAARNAYRVLFGSMNSINYYTGDLAHVILRSSALSGAQVSALVGTLASTYGGACSWIGGTGPWGAATNWSGGVAPGGLDAAVINNGGAAQLAAGAASAYALTLGGAGAGTLAVSGGALNIATLTLGGGGTLTLTAPANGMTAYRGSIVVESGGTLHTDSTDVWGNSGITASPTLTLNAGGVLANSNSFTPFVNPTLAGGTVKTYGGKDAAWRSYGFKGTVTVTGSSPSTIGPGGSGNGFDGLNIGDNTAAMAGSVTFNVANVTGDAGVDLTIGVPLMNGGGAVSGLTKTGAGTLLLTAASTYSGPTAVNAGTLQFNAGGSAYNNGTVAGAITVGSGATLYFNRQDVFGNADATTPVAITVNPGGLIQNGPIFNNLNNLTLNGGELRSNGGSTGGWQAYELRGTVTVGGGAPSSITANTSVNTLNQILLSRAGATTFDVADATADANPDLTVSAALVDGNGVAASLVKSGPGTLLLSAANTYSGATTVNGGLLLVNGTHSGAGAYTVNGGGVLGGSGTIGAAVTVASGGTLTPGGTHAPGILTVNGAVALQAGGAFLADIRGVNPGTGYDQLSMTGALQLDGAALAVTVAGGYAPADGTVFTIVTGFSGLAGTFAGLPEGAPLASGPWAFVVHYDAAGKTIALTSRRLGAGTVLIVR